MEDLPPESPEAQRFAAILGRQTVVAVRRNAVAEEGSCYWVVDCYCTQYGGRLRLGWMVTWLPGVYLEAMHHGIWENALGELLDLSAGRPARNGLTTFVPDDSLAIDLQYPVMEETRFLDLVDDDLVMAAHAAYRANLGAAKDLNAIFKMKGVPWAIQTGWQPTVDILQDPAVRAAIATVEATFLALEESDRKVQEKYFSRKEA